MTPERWQQVSHLYHAALECNANARTAFLNEMCAGDAALRQEVEWLLSQGQSAEGSLAAPALEVVLQRMADNPVRSLTGRQIASYQCFIERNRTLRDYRCTLRARPPSGPPAASEIRVVLNWLEELKRLVPR